MDRWLKQIMTPALFALTALVGGALSVGCVTQVIGGGGNGGAGGSGGTGGSGGAGGSGNAGEHGGAGGGNTTGSSMDECMKGETLVCPNSCMAPDGTSATSGGSGLIDGHRSCRLADDGHLFWGPCECDPTPLVLSFDRAPVAFAATAASYAFDLTGIGVALATDWPTPRTPWLALDRDGDGRIDGGGELFGSATVLGGGGRAENGFIALRELDTNGDGRITEADEAWSRLLLWSDDDGDRVSRAGELVRASSRRLLSIELGYTNARRCDDRGNCEVERATFRYLDEAGVERTGDIIDVHLRAQ